MSKKSKITSQIPIFNSPKISGKETFMHERKVKNGSASESMRISAWEKPDKGLQKREHPGRKMGNP